MTTRTFSFGLSVLIAVLAGCKGMEFKSPAATNKKTTKTVVKKILTPENTGRKRAGKEELDVIAQAYESSRSTTVSTGAAEEVAVRKVTAEINKSLELGPTLVIWLIDRTSSAYKLASGASTGAKGFYESQPVKQMTLDGEQKLQSVVAGFDERVEYILAEPTDDWQKVRDSFDKVQQSENGKEMTFTAVKEVLAKYSAGSGSQRQIVLVIVTNEAGDDANLADEAISLVKKNAIPVYVIGSAAPWGQVSPFEDQAAARRGPKSAEKDKADANTDANPVVGPESLASERVNLPLPVAGYGFRGKPEEELMESGFGPFALERLCRAGGGAYVPVRPVGLQVYAYGSTKFWPTGAELRFEPGVIHKYTPDYVSETDYNKLIADNKARFALHEAAKLGKCEILDNPDTQFAKGASEAELKRRLDAAQQASARVAPQIDRLYDLLIAGEGDRDKLTSPRWQAQYDYALGRVLAAKVRNDSYNQMIASLKAGKGPKDAAEYNLEQADSYETSSALKKMADKAKLYLERVVKDHPGTPWAKLAADDLKVPFGWKWSGM